MSHRSYHAQTCRPVTASPILGYHAEIDQISTNVVTAAVSSLRAILMTVYFSIIIIIYVVFPSTYFLVFRSLLMPSVFITTAIIFDVLI